MKRKLILFVLVIVAMMCFAISASATTIDKDTTVTLNGSFTVEDQSVANPVVNLYDTDGYALVWYLNTDNKLVSDRAVNLITVTDNKAKFNDVSKFYGGSQQKGVIVVNLRDDFVPDGIKGIEKFDSNFQFGYYGANKNVPIQYFYFPKTATEIIDRMFQNTQLIIADIEPGTPITYMGVHAVAQTNLKEFFVPKGIPNFIEKDDLGVFQDTQLEKITFEEGSQITVIPYRCFYMCKNLKELILPNTVEEIHYRALQFSMFGTEGKLEKLVLGASFKGFKGLTSDNFYVRGAANVKVYFPATFKASNVDVSTAHQYFTNCPNATFYYCGTEAEWDALITEISKGKNGATGNDSGENIITAKKNGKVTFNVSACDSFYNSIHVYKEDSNCKEGAECKRCTNKLASQIDHTYYSSLEYPKGYTQEGIYNYGCSNEGCLAIDITNQKADPIFEAKGYSTNSEKNAINGGYRVDFDALDLYTDVHGSLRYGIIIANANSFDGEMLDSEFKVTSQKAIQVEINNDYSNFDCTISYGANTGASLELVITAYTIDASGNVTFIQADSVYAESATIGSSTFQKITLQKVVANQPASKNDEEDLIA